jgi:GDP-L-fucose synthase
MHPNARILIVGARTFVGAAIRETLIRQGYRHVAGDTSQSIDLAEPAHIDRLFADARPEHVFLVGGKAGGIMMNQKRPADLMLDNLLVQSQAFRRAHDTGVTKLLYLASACCYPRDATQPMSVESLWTGPLEPTNEPYALAKLVGIRLGQAFRQQFGDRFISAIPANIFGPGDDFSPEESHVVAALIRRMHEAKASGAKAVEIWGSGLPRREFVFVDDVADACVYLMKEYDEILPINVGAGTDLSIADLAHIVRDVVGYGGELRFDTSKPDGMPSKTLDSRLLLGMGWRPQTPFRTAVERTYDSFRALEGRPLANVREPV